MTPERIEALAALWAELETEEYRLKQRKKDLLEELGNATDKSSGTATLEGVSRKISLKFRENVRYPDKDALMDWFTQHEEGEELFRVELKERKAAVEKYLKDGGEKAVTLGMLREVNSGSPAVKVKKMQ